MVYQRRQFEQARAQFEDVVRIDTRRLDADHPDTLTSRQNLAGALVGTNKIDDALVMLREVAQARVQVLGTQHPDTLESRSLR